MILAGHWAGRAATCLLSTRRHQTDLRNLATLRRGPIDEFPVQIQGGAGGRPCERRRWRRGNAAADLRCTPPASQPSSPGPHCADSTLGLSRPAPRPRPPLNTTPVCGTAAHNHGAAYRHHRQRHRTHGAGLIAQPQLVGHAEASPMPQHGLRVPEDAAALQPLLSIVFRGHDSPRRQIAPAIFRKGQAARQRQTAGEGCVTGMPLTVSLNPCALPNHTHQPQHKSFADLRRAPPRSPAAKSRTAAGLTGNRCEPASLALSALSARDARTDKGPAPANGMPCRP
ncbi:hypothetical protein B0J12DRAFT_371763 [Macrophomina phaseolina]|uniref:Uncharacterized protein n=1 Tax=Macrophomina phaseolina TaxID=35725 RepID=A0ABQ8GKS8_9PEZI|nr:hypothetical protein B0J12DRAFT_371763 [Macrophomina phaseolina]